MKNFTCPTASAHGDYVRTRGEVPDSNVEIVVCENDRYTITGQEGKAVLIYDNTLSKYITAEELE